MPPGRIGARLPDDSGSNFSAVRILIVNYEYPPLGGGGGVLSRMLVAELGRAHDVVVLTSRGLDLPRESFDDGARVIRAPVPGRSDPNKASMASLLAFPVAARRAAARSLGRWRPDVVHTFFAVPSGPAGAALARRRRAPHVLTVIGADIYDPTRRLSPDRFRPLGATVGRVVRGAEAVAAISSDIASRATALTGREGIAVIPCAAEETPLPRPDRTALGWGRSEVVVVSTARLVARKGYDVLIRAAALAPENVRLVIVGDGPQRAALETLAAETGRRVELTGSLSAAERDLRLVSADAFALASHHEGFGIAILEAMRAGIPVVATDAGGPPDFVGDGGFLVPPGDDAELADRLTRLAKDPALRERMGAAARARAADFTPPRMATRYLSLYDEARRRAGSP